MKLFVSYARVDQPICRDIVSTLRAHEVWHDERIYGAQKWWDKIEEMIGWCTGFVYLLSPESVESEYCRKEFALALNSGDKHIFPVIVQDHPDTQPLFPDELRAYQWIDMRDWRSHEAVANLLNAIYIAEMGGQRPKTLSPKAVEPPQPIRQRLDAARVIEQVDRLMDAQQFDPALLLLRSLIESETEVPSRIRRILEEMIRECEEKLGRQTYERQVMLEYAPLAAAVRGKRTRELGCAAFAEFHREFPDYDPDNLTAICAEVATDCPTPHLPKRALPPPFEWRRVPAGRVIIEYGEWQGSGYVVARTQTFDVSPFKIAKYPITNAQFQMFADDAGGFANHEWWNFSDTARQWRRENPTPAPPAFPGDDHPRGNLCWYEAMAFCRWLTAVDGDAIISLPTEQQWQWAAQGKDRRIYPWGDDFDAACCNTHENGLGQTISVTAYPSGASPFGLLDLAGNVWEWCLTVSDGTAGEERARVLRGGSWDYDASFARTAFRGRSFPHRRVIDFGFRICCAP